MSFFLFLCRTEPDCLAAQLYFAPVSRVSPRVAQAAEHRLASFSDMARHSRERKFRPGADCYRTSGLVATSVRISQLVGPAREQGDSSQRSERRIATQRIGQRTEQRID